MQSTTRQDYSDADDLSVETHNPVLFGTYVIFFNLDLFIFGTRPLISNQYCRGPILM